jgi:hypothetical protein
MGFHNDPQIRGNPGEARKQMTIHCEKPAPLSSAKPPDWHFQKEVIGGVNLLHPLHVANFVDL